jgi:glycosyltransferase involved in cell wall biosynthesis
MEGSFDSTQLADADCKPDSDKISIMYSGVLDLRYGIPELLDAMDLLDEHYELWLTGAGNAEDLIRQRAATDERIKFYGYLPSRQDLLNKQAQATMLISPRRDTEEASKYCFPSKLFEYMVSGRPVISCFLAGIPAEYHNHLIQLPSASAQEIAAIIKKTAKLSAQERSTIGSAAKKFVLENKNKFAQAKKIAEFMDIV